MKPSTAEILQVICKDVILVGSVAHGCANPKDLDLVVRDRGMKDRNPVFSQVISKWKEYVESEVPGHLVVFAEPLTIEMFEYDCWDTKDDDKNANRTTFRKAKGNSQKCNLFGVELLKVRN